MKLSEYDKVVGTYKTYISDFYICDPRSGHFHDLISQWAKINSVSSIKVIEPNHV